jgi:UDP-N-acetylglucosamine transferase subunit ALG13
MILVTVGSSPLTFDRMLSNVDRILAGLRIEEEVIFQLGDSDYRPVSGAAHRFFNFETMRRHVRAADLVISHAGIGSILLCLTNNRKPVIYPRLKKYRENVDDHQLQIALCWGRHGLVFNSPSEEGLAKIVRGCRSGAASFALPELTEERALLIKTVSSLI